MKLTMKTDLLGKVNGSYQEVKLTGKQSTKVIRKANLPENKSYQEVELTGKQLSGVNRWNLLGMNRQNLLGNKGVKFTKKLNRQNLPGNYIIKLGRITGTYQETRPPQLTRKLNQQNFTGKVVECIFLRSDSIFGAKWLNFGIYTS